MRRKLRILLITASVLTALLALLWFACLRYTPATESDFLGTWRVSSYSPVKEMRSPVKIIKDMFEQGPDELRFKFTEDSRLFRFFTFEGENWTVSSEDAYTFTNSRLSIKELSSYGYDKSQSHVMNEYRMNKSRVGIQMVSEITGTIYLRKAGPVPTNALTFIMNPSTPLNGWRKKRN